MVDQATQSMGQQHRPAHIFLPMPSSPLLTPIAVRCHHRTPPTTAPHTATTCRLPSPLPASRRHSSSSSALSPSWPVNAAHYHELPCHHHRPPAITTRRSPSPAQHHRLPPKPSKHRLIRRCPSTMLTVGLLPSSPSFTFLHHPTPLPLPHCSPAIFSSSSPSNHCHLLCHHVRRCPIHHGHRPQATRKEMLPLPPPKSPVEPFCPSPPSCPSLAAAAIPASFRPTLLLPYSNSSTQVAAPLPATPWPSP